MDQLTDFVRLVVPSLLQFPHVPLSTCKGSSYKCCHSVSNSLQFSKETTDFDSFLVSLYQPVKAAATRVVILSQIHCSSLKKRLTSTSKMMKQWFLLMLSVFPAVPFDKTYIYIRKKLENDPSLHSRTNFDIDGVVSLLDFVLSNNYFVYWAMGSPVSPVVANICMEVIEDSAINATPVPPRYWKRYVDDSFCIIKKDAVSSLHGSLNSTNPHIFLSPLNMKRIVRHLSSTC